MGNLTLYTVNKKESKMALGFNIQVSHRKAHYDARLKAMKLPSLTIIGDKSVLGYAKEMQDATGCLIVARMIPLEIGPTDPRYGQGDPIAAAKKWVADLVAYVGPEIFTKYKSFYWQCAWDEKKEFYEWNSLFTVAAIKEARRVGICLCLINLFWGNPPEVGRFPEDKIDGWDLLWPAITEAFNNSQTDMVVGLHAYIDPHHPITLEDQRHALTRPAHFVEKARKAGIKARVVITETGLTTYYEDANIKDLPTYGKALCVADSIFNSYPEILAENIYTLDNLDGVEIGGKFVGGVFPAVPAPVPGYPKVVSISNPSFEGGTHNQDNNPNFIVPNDWQAYQDLGSLHVESEPANLQFAIPHAVDGEFSARLWGSYEKVDGGLYQIVNAVKGHRYRLSSQAMGWSTNNAQPGTPSQADIFAWVGINPTGSFSRSADVVWSPDVNVRDKWWELSVEVVAQADKVCLFVSMANPYAMARNDVFFDAVELVDLGPTIVTPPVPTKKYVTTSPTGLNVRRGPGFDYSIIGGIGANTPFVVVTLNPPLQKENNWVEVLVNGELGGWCYAKYVAFA
jgi:hypothetical protein